MKLNTSLLLSILMLTPSFSKANESVEEPLRENNKYQMVGSIKYDGMIYGTYIQVDKLHTKPHALYLFPSQYRLQKFVGEDNFTLEEAINHFENNRNFKGKVSCPVGKGKLGAYSHKEIMQGIECQWIENPTSDAQAIDFKLHLKKKALIHNFIDILLDHRAGFEYQGKILKGSLFEQSSESDDVKLALNTFEYQNSSNDKTVFIRGNTRVDGKRICSKVRFNRKMDVDGDGKADYKVKLLSCDHGMSSLKSIDYIVNTPKVTCHFLIKEKQNKKWVNQPLIKSVLMK